MFLWKVGGGNISIFSFSAIYAPFSSNLRHNKIQANQSRKMEQKYYFTCNIRNISKTSLLCSVHWVSQDVTAGSGDHCALQWHSVHSHQQRCSLQRPVTILPLTTCSGGGNKAAMTTPAHIWCLCSHPVTVFMGHKMIAGHFSDGRVQNAGRLLKWL